MQIYEILQLQIYEISQLQIYEISQLQLQDDIGVSGVVGSAVFNITLVCFIFLKRTNIIIIFKNNFKIFFRQKKDIVLFNAGILKADTWNQC